MTRRTVSEEYLIHYLRHEIDRHRRAVRTIFVFIVGSGGALAALLVDFFNRQGSPSGWGFVNQWPSLALALVPVVLIAVASFFFQKYFREIASLKARVYDLIRARIKDDKFLEISKVR